jgi:hypothetical protein
MPIKICLTTNPADSIGPPLGCKFRVAIGICMVPFRGKNWSLLIYNGDKETEERLRILDNFE